MALKDILNIQENQQTYTVSIEDIDKERIKKDLPQLKKVIAYWRA